MESRYSDASGCDACFLCCMLRHVCKHSVSTPFQSAMFLMQGSRGVRHSQADRWPHIPAGRAHGPVAVVGRQGGHSAAHVTRADDAHHPGHCSSQQCRQRCIADLRFAWAQNGQCQPPVGQPELFAPSSFCQAIDRTSATSCAGYVRFWLSAGRGGFGLSSSECESPTFYCMAHSTGGTRPDITKGWKVESCPASVSCCMPRLV